MVAMSVTKGEGGLPNGAHFRKCALQLNPFGYLKSYRGEEQDLDEAAYNEAVTTVCLEAGVSVVGITDHNTATTMGPLRESMVEAGIAVFPGFEVASSEGVHVLCLYDHEKSEADLRHFLGELGIPPKATCRDLSTKSFVEILACVRRQGGITIAAHSTLDGGLLVQLHGTARANAWRDENLLAAQIPGMVDDLPMDKRQIVKNQDPMYKRLNPVAEDLGIAVINAKDVARPGDLSDPATSTWLKMASVSVEGLRQAFLDPASRVRLNSDPTPEEHMEFVSLRWHGGFLDGQAVHFNENLNVLVGGRGSGKSTIVESLRYVLGLEPVGDEAKRAHQGIVRSVLKSGTKLSLHVKTSRPAPREYYIERTVPNPPVLRSSGGDMLELAPTELLRGVDIFGQHEISELTRSPEKLTRLLDRFLDKEDLVESRREEIRKALDKSRDRMLALQRELRSIEDKLATLPAVEETLRTFQEAGLEERLKDQSQLVREEKVIRTAEQRVEDVKRNLASLLTEIELDRAFLSDKALDGLPGAPLLARLEPALSDLDRELRELIGGALLRVEAAAARVQSVKSEWDIRREAVQREYENILRELHRSSVDGEEFMRLRRQVEELRPLRDRVSLLQHSIQEVARERKGVLAEWEDLKSGDFRRLQKAASKVTRQLKGRVRVEVQYGASRDDLVNLLTQRGGRLKEAMDLIRAEENLSLVELATLLQEGTQSLRTRYGFTPSQAETLASLGTEVAMQVEELELAPATAIQLNVGAEGGDPVWKDLSALSTGQKATAVLLLLLLESDAPLVVDQPEDDLDNRFITEGVVPKMKEEKRRRQFVFATHNANIPVLGDAELIVGLRPALGEGTSRAEIPEEHMGAIDTREVRNLVEELLEGGRAAFEMRRLKYGF